MTASGTHAPDPSGVEVRQVGVLVGGVSQLYQGDLDLGRRAADVLAAEDLGDLVAVEDLHYGAVAVAQRIDELSPHTLVLVGAEARGRSPGTVERRRVEPAGILPAAAQGAVADAVTGYVSIDLVVEVAHGFGVLPPRTVVVEVEPARTAPGEELSPAVEQGLGRALDIVRAEVRRAPLLELAGRLRDLLDGDRLEPTPALETLADLLDELDLLDREGRWGRAFAERDRLRLRIADGQTGEGMDHLDWSLWWALIEELDRLERLEVSGAP